MKGKKSFKTFLRILVSLALLGLVLYQVPWDKFRALPARMNGIWLVPAFLFYFLSKIISAYRAGKLLEDAGYYAKRIAYQQLYFKGMWYNLLLPGGVSGDAWKVWKLKSHPGKGVKWLIAAALYDRLSGVAAMLVWACICLAFMLPNYVWLFLMVWIPGLIIFGFLTKKMFSLFYARWKEGMVLSLAAQLLAGFTALCLWFCLDRPGEWEFLLPAFYLSNLASVLPVTMGGIGLREWVLMQLGGDFGPEYLAIALIFTGIHTLVSMSGMLAGGWKNEELNPEQAEAKP